MNLANYETINDILEELRQEDNDLKQFVDANLSKMQEIDSYVQSLLSEDDSDFKMFSPRNAEDKHKEEIANANADMMKLRQELKQYYEKQNLLQSKIDRLENIVKGNEEYHSDSVTRKKNLRILNIQEQDRQRIARDLHDTSLQNLAHLVHKIELSRLYIDQDPIKAKLELTAVNKNLKLIIDEIRNTIFNLRPMTFDDLGLKSAFQNLIGNANEDKKYKVDMQVENPSCDDNLILAAIYRIVQESIANICKHAEATKISFYGKNEKDVYIIDIEDNGKGFSEREIDEKKDHHFGMTVMKERVSLLGGKISIHSDRGKGTHIHIEIPMT